MIKPKSKKHGIFKIFVWVSIVVLLIQIPFSSQAICFGEDGHVLLEPVVEGKCCSFDVKHIDEIIQLKDSHSEQSGHCGDCVDLVLSFEELIRHSQIRHIANDKDIILELFTVHVMKPCGYISVINNTKNLEKSNNPPPKSFSLISSTVLRI